MAVLWHTVGVDKIVATLSTSEDRGLEPDEAARRLMSDGRNELQRGQAISPWAIFVSQFKSLVVGVLIGAAAVSLVLGEYADGIAIGAIVVLNALIGFYQEYQAEQALAALARLAAPRARVLRGGVAITVPAADVVRGDVVLLDGGDLVPADARLIEAAALRVNEAPLTGESAPVQKHAETCPAETPLADRVNMVFLATSIAGGSARAVVVATGMNTEVGHIAALLETATSGETPLQARLDQIGRQLLWACSVVVALVFALGMMRSLPIGELFLTAISLAVAAIPEGLPAVVTVALALGVSRMVRRHALVRRLAAVETLGCTQVICTDKTGTLTVGEMTARRLVTAEHTYAVTGEGYKAEGGLFVDGRECVIDQEPVLHFLLEAAAACVDAEIELRGGTLSVVGDPTEAALLVVAEKGGVRRAEIEANMPRLGSVPFDSDRKRMTIVRNSGDGPFAFVKGAPEIIFARSTQMLTKSGPQPLTDASRAGLAQASTMMAADALRVLAIARRPLIEFPVEGDIETELTLVGLVGMQDPPRAEARDAVAKCKQAGIRTVMITGDHPSTAQAIARELGILSPGDGIMTGVDLDHVEDDNLRRRAQSVAVYARVTAEHKLRIVRAWKAEGSIVAMTGDGVNDAPALKEASIGIAMGISGTEVTKEAADMVITDDNFASIVAAVEEGRGIYDNIGKTLGYLLAGNAGELAIMLIAVLVGWPLPLLPIQLLWINLVTDGLPALALATDPIDPDVLTRPPRPANSQLIDWPFLRRLVLTGFLTASVALVAFAYELWIDGNVMDARNAAFSVLVMAELLRAFGARSDVRPVWEVGLFSNLRLFWVVAVSFVLQLVIHHSQMLETFFGTEPITLAQCGAWIGLGLIPLAVLEALKVIGATRRE